MSKQSVFLISILLVTAARGQGITADMDHQLHLRGRHSIQVTASLLNVTSDASVSIGRVRTDAETDGLAGSVAYSYWVRDEMAIGASIGVMDAGVSVSVGTGDVSSRSAVVIPILFGGTLYPRSLALRPNVRPFISLAAGPFVGSATRTVTEIGNVVSETITETALGGRLLAGVEWFASNRFRIGIGAGYHLMTDFGQRIGSDDNFSGPEFNLGLGLIF